MNELINETDKNYKSMLFKEALKSGFYEFQSARDQYRELSMDGTHRDLIFQFIENQALILAPICPHVSEHVWQLIHGKVSGP